MDSEHRNDLRKRLYHRIVARALAGNPGLLAEAMTVVRRWQREPNRAHHVDEWAKLLAQPPAVVRREITKRGEDMTRLRIDSPFYLTQTRVVANELRSRIARMASSLASAR